MAVDPAKPRTVLIVHGVQTCDTNLDQDVLVDNLIRSRIGSIPLQYQCDLYRYENLNVAAQQKLHNLLNAFIVGKAGEALADAVLEMVGDVVISCENGSCASEIRTGLREKILGIYEQGNPCYVVAHSLGSVYAFDVLNQLIAQGGYFDRGSRKSWPVQGLMTLGSPIGLDLFKKPGRDCVHDFGPGDKWFRWLNMWDPNDPVVSGNIFGAHLSSYKIAELFLSGSANQGWVIRDIVTDTGKAWLSAHCAYWHSPVVGDKLVDMITS